MTEALHTLVESLPETSLTTRLLGALDYVIPGEWQNVVVFEQLVKNVTGETDEALVQQVGERAIALYADDTQGYQRAVTVYRAVDHASTVAGAAALASMASERFEILDFLKDVAPKPDTVQAVDAGIKLAAELAAFCLHSGIPGDSVGDFASAVVNYGKEDRARMTAWLAFDCLVPLGPDFLAKILDAVRGLELDALANHKVFRLFADHLPGDMGRKKELIEQNVTGAGEKLASFGSERGMTRESLLDKVRQYIDVADDKLDVVAAAIDMGTNTFEHTGIQTVARKIVSRAYGEI